MLVEMPDNMQLHFTIKLWSKYGWMPNNPWRISSMTKTHIKIKKKKNSPNLAAPAVLVDQDVWTSCVEVDTCLKRGSDKFSCSLQWALDQTLTWERRSCWVLWQERPILYWHFLTFSLLEVLDTEIKGESYDQLILPTTQRQYVLRGRPYG